MGRKVFTINVGDSTSLYLKRDEGNHNFSAQALNWVHKPTDLDEMRRIMHSKGSIMNDYLIISQAYGLQTGLAVSRAVGDIDFDGYGISHEPDITIVDIDLDREGYLINCCDGVTDVMNGKDIAIFFSDHGIHNNPATDLCKEAYLRGSMDNISVVVTPILFTHKKGVLSFVADGHRGKYVADLIKKNYFNELSTCILKTTQP